MIQFMMPNHMRFTTFVKIFKSGVSILCTLRHGWTGIYEEYKEADDIIAEKVLEAFENPDIKDILIFTQDSDLHQLYSWDLPEGKTLRISNVQNVINPSDIETDLGISLNQFVDWKSLTGDTTDNITSIPGLGPVKALNLYRV